MTEKTASLTITVSSNPLFDERYFVDFRDTTGGRDRQLRTWHMDADDVRFQIGQLKVLASQHDITLTIDDRTGEIA